MISQDKFQGAYTRAFQCDHGCKCQFIDKQYHELNSEIARLEGLIVGLEGEIDLWEGEIAAWEATDCDFSVIRAKYEVEWDRLEDEHEAQIAALADWKNDGYELHDAVDQEAFKEAYGFEYDSHRWDEWYKGYDNTL